jgi:hypothetical protein
VRRGPIAARTALVQSYSAACGADRSKRVSRQSSSLFLAALFVPLVTFAGSAALFGGALFFQATLLDGALVLEATLLGSAFVRLMALLDGAFVRFPALRGGVLIVESLLLGSALTSAALSSWRLRSGEVVASVAAPKIREPHTFGKMLWLGRWDEGPD